jgi:hypothetical protein
MAGRAQHEARRLIAGWLARVLCDRTLGARVPGPQVRARLGMVIEQVALTPQNFRPLEMGFDLMLPSALKYLNGNSDVVAGAVASTATHAYETCARHSAFRRSPRSSRLLPAAPGPQDVASVRGRTGRRRAGAEPDGFSAVERGHYTELPADPSHSRASRWFSGHGGLLRGPRRQRRSDR